MALLRKLFQRKLPPDRLLEISDRVYVFDCCFTTDSWDEKNYKAYLADIVNQLQDQFLDAALLVFNFGKTELETPLSKLMSDYGMTVMDYPRHYEGCPILPMELIHHFLRSTESWLSLAPHNILLLHCERGGWPVLAFMLAALLIYRKQYSGVQRTLDMVYKQAPRELLRMLSPLNPIPSQIRYLQYVSWRNVSPQWPPLNRALTLDCIIFRLIPDFDGEGGCCPIFRIYGQDPLSSGERTPKLLFSTPKRSKTVRFYNQKESRLVKIDINCKIQGDIVLECTSVHRDLEHEDMMFRIMFNTGFVRSNILMLGRDEIDTLWDTKELFPKDFRAEVLFSDMDAASSIVFPNLSCFEGKNGLPIEAFATVQEFFSHVDWLDSRAQSMVQKVSASHISHECYDVAIVPLNGDSNSGITLSPQNEGSKANILCHFKNNNTNKELLCQNVRKHYNLRDRKDEPNSSEALLNQYQQEIRSSMHEDTRMRLTTPYVPEKEGVLSPNDIKDGKILPGLSVVSESACIVLLPVSPSQQASLSVLQEMSTSVSSQSQQHAAGLEVQLSCKDAHTGLEDASQSSKTSQSSVTACGNVATILHGTLLPPPEAAKQSHIGPMNDNSNAMAISQPEISSSPGNTVETEKEFLSSSLRPNSTAEGLEPTLEFSDTDEKSASGTGPSLPKFSTKTSEYEPVEGGSLPSQPLAPSLKDSTVNYGPPLPTIPPLGVNRGKVGTPTAAPPLPLGKAPPMLPPPAPTLPPPPPPPPPPAPTPHPSQHSYPELRQKQPPTPPLGPGIQSLQPPSPPPPPPPLHGLHSQKRPPVPPPPPPGPGLQSQKSSPPPPPPPPCPGLPSCQQPPPPPPPGSGFKSKQPQVSSSVPCVPPHPTSVSNGAVKKGSTLAPTPPLSSISEKGRRYLGQKSSQGRKLKPLHWLKLSRAAEGSLWAETQHSGETSITPEIDMSELENLFSASTANSDQGAIGGNSRRGLGALKSDIVQLIDHRRAYNCEIMLSKIKVPFQELVCSVLSLEDSSLDIDQVENLIKFCPTKEEMELLKGYTGEVDKLGKCEQFFLELMRLPRVEGKLRVFSFKKQFRGQVSDLRKSLSIVNSAADQIRSSVKLKRIMQTVLSLGNALNQGTARGSAVGFRLDSLLKLTETRAQNSKMTLMHYLCKIIAEKLPEVLDFSKELSNIEPATKIQLKFLAEEMQALNKGLEKVVQELSMSENDGPISDVFRKNLKDFLSFAEAEVRSLASLYSWVGRNVDALIVYFGEDPARCSYEQVVTTLLNFMRMFQPST